MTIRRFAIGLAILLTVSSSIALARCNKGCKAITDLLIIQENGGCYEYSENHGVAAVYTDQAVNTDKAKPIRPVVYITRATCDMCSGCTNTQTKVEATTTNMCMGAARMQKSACY